MKNIGIFSMKTKWFKYSDYEIVPYNNKNPDILAIKAKPGSKLIWYNPFEEYPVILKDFLELFNSLDILTQNVNDEVMNREEAGINSPKRAELFLKFIKEYGFFGMLWEVTTFAPGPHTIGLNIPGITEAEYQFNHKPGEDINEYVSRKYFPDMNKPIPSPLINRLPNNPVSKKYFLNYKETINRVEHSYIFDDIKSHYNKWNKGIKKNIVFDNIGIGINIEEVPKISWNYTSLLSALKIMYVLNITGDMGKNRVKVCERQDCNNTFIVGPAGKKEGTKYCSDNCGNVVRVRRSRNKKELILFI